MRKIMSVLMATLCLFMVLNVTACGDPTITGDYTISNNQITLEKLGETATLVVKVGATAVVATWESDDDNLVTVKDGVVTAVKNGTANITATYEGKEVSCEVVVASVFALQLVDKVQFVNLTIGGKKDLEPVVILPSVNDTDDTFIVATSDDSVATVNAMGVVTAIGKGTATITITSNAKVSVPDPMGRPIAPQTKSASTKILFIVDNEYSATTNASLIGNYSGFIDWDGYATEADQEADTTPEGSNKKRIRAIAKLELKTDGTFVYSGTNAKRLVREGQTNKLFPFNPIAHSVDLVGYAATKAGAHGTFTDRGEFAILNGNLHLLLISGFGVARAIDSGAIAGNAWLKDFNFITNLIDIHAEMVATLVKDSE